MAVVTKAAGTFVCDVWVPVFDSLGHIPPEGPTRALRYVGSAGPHAANRAGAGVCVVRKLPLDVKMPGLWRLKLLKAGVEETDGRNQCVVAVDVL